MFVVAPNGKRDGLQHVKEIWSQFSGTDRLVLGMCLGLSLSLAFTQFQTYQVQQKEKRAFQLKTAQLSNGAFDTVARSLLETLDQNLPDTAHASSPHDAIDDEAYFVRGQLRDLNLHEGTVPGHTRTDEHRILQDYSRALRPNQGNRWVQDRVQDYLDRRDEQYEFLGIVRPRQYDDLQTQLNAQKERQFQVQNSNETKGVARLERQKFWKAQDTQNVHDSGVTSSMRAMIAKLIEKDGEVVMPLGGMSESSDEIARYIMEGDFQPEVKEKALRACHFIANSRAVHTALSNHSEKDVLNLVWRRAYHPCNNKEDRANIQDMVVHSLADTVTSSAMEPLEHVCVTGRISRLVDALTYTDQQSEVIGQPISLDAMRNDIYDFTQKTLQSQIEHFTNEAALDVTTQDSEMRRVAQSYTDPSIVVDEASEQCFKNKIVSQADEYMKEQYGSKLSMHHQQDILDAVQAAL